MYDIIYKNPINNTTMFAGPPRITSPLYDICSAILTILVMFTNYYPVILNNILTPLEASIYNNDGRLNDIIKDTVDNKLPPIITARFTPDLNANEILRTKRFIHKLMPYIILFCSINVYFIEVENDISRYINNVDNNGDRLEFTNFHLIKLTTNLNNDIVKDSIIDITETNIDAVNKIIDLVNVMSESL